MNVSRVLRKKLINFKSNVTYFVNTKFIIVITFSFDNFLFMLQFVQALLYMFNENIRARRYTEINMINLLQNKNKIKNNDYQIIIYIKRRV